jgi:hypothetical protein
MSRPVSYDIIDMVLLEVGKIKEASHQRRHIPQEHMVALNLCLDEAQLDGEAWTQENMDAGYDRGTYFEFWKDPDRRQDQQDFVDFELTIGGMLHWCKCHAKPPETLGWHKDPEAGDSVKVLNNW